MKMLGEKMLGEIFFLCLAVGRASAAATSANPKGVFARQVSLPNYNYEGTTGPVNWHGIQDDYATCATGQNQSPINFNPSDLDAIASGDVEVNIPAGQTPQFFNQDVNVQVNIEGNTVISGQNFNLQQFHFHTPSEHRVNDEYFPVEVHFVHAAEDDPSSIAVIGILFEVVKNKVDNGPSAYINQVLESVDQIQNPGDSTDLGRPGGQILRRFLRALSNSSYRTYPGSLTTPPCSEGVTWLVSDERFQIGVDAFNSLKSVVNFNARFTQGAPGSQNLLELAAEQLAAL